MERTLFIGIGAPKCGTSWLYGYLRNHPEVFLSPVKEFNHFIARYRSDLSAFWDERFRKSAAEMQAKYDIEPTPRRLRYLTALNARVATIEDPSAYMAYFESAAEPQHKVVGEISPGYCILRDDGFQSMRSQTPKTRLLFLLRDPVERFWSGQRFKQRLGGADAIMDFTAALTTFPGAELARYDLTLQSLDRVFAPGEVRIEFFERLFKPEAIKGICDWLEIDFVQPDFARVVNGSLPLDLPQPLEAKAREVLAPVYDYCKARFGDTLPKSWRVVPASVQRQGNSP